MHSGEQKLELVARFSTLHPAVTVLRQVIYFSGVALYLVMLTVMTNGILGPHLQDPQVAATLSVSVTAPALVVALIFYSTRPILYSRGLAWRTREFFAMYALVMLVTLLFAAALWSRPGTMAVVTVLTLGLTLILPSIQRLVTLGTRAGEPLVAAVVLLVVPTAQGAVTTLLKGTQGPYALVELRVERPREGPFAFLHRSRDRAPHMDC